VVTRDGQKRFNNLNYTLLKQESYPGIRPGQKLIGYSVRHVQEHIKGTAKKQTERKQEIKDNRIYAK
jgi:hypothetical protein